MVSGLLGKTVKDVTHVYVLPARLLLTLLQNPATEVRLGPSQGLIYRLTGSSNSATRRPCILQCPTILGSCVSPVLDLDTRIVSRPALPPKLQAFWQKVTSTLKSHSRIVKQRERGRGFQ